MSRRLEDVLAQRLRELAALRRMPLSHVADRAAVARSYFWLLLEGESSATLDVIQRIAVALDVAPLTLLTVSADTSVNDETKPLAPAAPRRPPTGQPAKRRSTKSR